MLPLSVFLLPLENQEIVQPSYLNTILKLA
uniref:Uncharacterized protein n=1 Tax=Myoviridae sp. ct6F13 TaxID=2827602 RepID=A0A8S5LJC6_9CAUD|nr:MAG TPA: hypothetical protein [Myoviridae sp. ct6F13]